MDHLLPQALLCALLIAALAGHAMLAPLPKVKLGGVDQELGQTSTDPRGIAAFAALIALLVGGGIALGMLGATRAPQLWAWGSTAALLTVTFITLHARTSLPPIALAAAGAAIFSLVVADLLPQAAITALAALCAFAGADLVSRQLGPQGALALVALMTVSDVLMFHGGVLERFVYGSAREDTVTLHSLAALQVGDWALGAGDILVAGLLGACLRSASIRQRALGAGLFGMGVIGCMIWASNMDTPVPATTPAVPVLALIAILTWRGRRSAVAC